MFLPLLIAATTVVLAEQSHARMPVVVAPDAPVEVEAVARDLAQQLERISGARFSVERGDGSRGISLSLVPTTVALDRENYALTSHAEGLRVRGATPLALTHAVWDLLYRFGYRQFFPGETWEIVPRLDRLAIAVEVEEKPSYFSRRIWFGHGPWDYNRETFIDWSKKNRLGGSLLMSSGHIYQKIVKELRPEFDAHPEWFGLMNGERKSTKLCISNPQLRARVVKYAVDHFAAHPEAESISMEPSDGGGWCECERCRALGSPSDRAVLLASEVAKQVKPRLVGMYAYNLHAPPPKFRAEPNVLVSVATAFLPGGWTADRLLDGWGAQGAQLGLREYFSVNAWDRDLPGRARAANTAYVAESIPRFHAKGARSFSAESGDNFGPCGLGYYLASRFLWNVGDAKNAKVLREDFLTRAFGPARAPIDRFYTAIDGANKPMLSDDLLGRMYRALDEARKLAGRDTRLLARIDALVLYTRYVELFHVYEASRGDARQPAFAALLTHTYRMRKTQMVHAKPIVKKLAKKDRAVTQVEVEKQPAPAFTAAEIIALSKTGVAGRPLAGFEPVVFEDELVQRASSSVKSSTAAPITTRGDFELRAVIVDAKQPVVLHVASGFFGPGRTYSTAEVELIGGSKMTIPQDGKFRRVELTAPNAGTFVIAVRDKNKGAKTTWPLGQGIGIVASTERAVAFHGRWRGWFYVPPGTKVVGGFASSAGVLFDGSDRIAAEFSTKPGYFSVPVPAGEDGKLWRFDKSAGQRMLMTVPPYLFRVPEEAVIPRAHGD